MAEKMTKTTTATKAEDTTKKKKTWDNEDWIPCRSLVSGPLYVEGYRTKFLYSWADFDDVVEVQYQDLIWMIRTRSNTTIYEPRIIIEENQLIAEHKEIGELYASLYSGNELKDIINLPAHQMKKVIEKLPNGAKEALKGIVSTMIDSKALDSVTKIKVLDEVLGTNMLLTLVQE